MKRIINGIAILCSLALFIFLPSYTIQADNRTDIHLALADFSPEEPLTYILSMAEQIKEPFLKCEILVEISTVYLELEEYNKAEYILSKAYSLAQNIKDPFSKAILLSELIDRYISLKRNEQAIEIAGRIDFADSRADALVKIMLSYIQQNQSARALDLVKSIEEPSLKAVALCKLIKELSEQKLYPEVLKVQRFVEQLSPWLKRLIWTILKEDQQKENESPILNFFIFRKPYKKTEALIAMAKNYITLKLYEPADYILKEAILVSKGIISQYLREDSLAQIAFVYIQMGNYEKAQEIVNFLKIPICCSELLAKIATAYAQGEEFEKALKVTADIDAQYFKEEALRRIIIQYLKCNQEEKASHIIDALDKVSSKDRLHSAVVDFYIQEANHRKAVETSKKISDPFIKLKTLLFVAKDLQKRKYFPVEIQKIFSEITSLSN